MLVLDNNFPVFDNETMFEKTKAFTLVELLVVIAILGILAAAILLVIDPAQKIKQSKDSRVKGDLNQISSALTAFYTESTGAFPLTYPTDLTSSVTINGIVVPQELKNVPKDPTTNADYVYRTSQTAGGVIGNCNNTPGSLCGAASLYGTALSSTGNTLFCWKSTSGTITPVAAAANCTP